MPVGKLKGRGMDFDLPLMDQARAAYEQGLVLARDWLLSPAAWSQFALLVAAYLLALGAGL